MKRYVPAIILTWIIAFWSGFLHAQQPFNAELPMTCGDGKNIIKGLNETYNEEIIFLAAGVNHRGDDIFHSMWISNDNKTWTFLVLNRNKNIVCVIASGDNYQLMVPDGI